MSRQVALDNLQLKDPERWGHSEYSLDYHADYLRQRTGVEPGKPGFDAAVRETFQFDFEFRTNDGLIDWAQAGRVSDMGHAVYAADGTDQREPTPSPFQTPEQVWEFDAVTEYGLPDEKDQIAAYEQMVINARTNAPRVVQPLGTYKTIMSGAIASFGWDMLLLAASDQQKMSTVLDSFFRRAHFLYRCIAQTSTEVVLTHDDFVWTSGPFLHPEVYREVIIPRYKALWDEVHKTGKTVVFCSDGDFTEFAEDVVDAGADALIFEPCCDYGFMHERVGDRCCLIGSYVDCRDLTFGHWDKVKNDIDRTFETLQDSRGAIVAVGNHLPPNIPAEMLDRYFKEILPRLEKARSCPEKSRAIH